MHRGAPSVRNLLTPTAGHEEKGSRLLPLPVAPAGEGGYVFLDTQDKQPVRWDPCRPIHYVIRDTAATPSDADAAIVAAVAVASRASGLSFVYDGKVDEAPVRQRQPFQPRYGDRWAPVLIAWSDTKETPDLVGHGGLTIPLSRTASAQSRFAYVSGTIVLNTQSVQQAHLNGDAVYPPNLIQHELGHLIGLDHVGDADELMNADGKATPGYGPGDLRGLAVLGSGSCHPEL
jgi:hypothetical protein